MQAQNQPSWRVHVRAKSRHFSFKFNAAKLSPTWKFHRLSLLFKLRSFFLRLNSESASSIPSRPQQQTLISKLRRILDKFRSKSTKKPSNRPKPEAKSALNRLSQYTREELICFGYLLAVTLGVVIQKVERFVFFLGVLLCVCLLRGKKFGLVKSGKLLVLLIAVMALFCSLVFDFTNNYLKFIEGHVSNYVWLPWKFLAYTLRN